MAPNGEVVWRMPDEIQSATPADVDELARVAAATFPLACPPATAAADITAFVAATLSVQRFGEYLADPGRGVLVARDDGRIIGYAMLVRGVGDDPDVAGSVPARSAVELSKLYVAAGHHGTGAAPGLMRAGIEWAAGGGAEVMWLGVNRENGRAQRFYRKHGFEITGTKTFRLGASLEHDYVMVRPV
jgi:ribosomal protein S18 acetylase RimI-like enzyme